MVPVLIDGDFVLWESNSICRYLVRKAGRDDLLPSQPQACANVERWMDWQATEFNNAWRYVFPALGRKNPDYNDPARIAAGIKEWNHCIGILEQQLQRTGAFTAGETFTSADGIGAVGEPLEDDALTNPQCLPLMPGLNVLISARHFCDMEITVWSEFPTALYSARIFYLITKPCMSSEGIIIKLSRLSVVSLC